MFSLVAKIANFANLIKRYERKQNIFLKVGPKKSTHTFRFLCKPTFMVFSKKSIIGVKLSLFNDIQFNLRHLTQTARGPDVFNIKDLVTNTNVENN